ncbi:MAG: glycosyltransferase [Rhodopseudomonas palustris]|nr:glycosyltransferase [Rhodopseudomonas palustris]
MSRSYREGRSVAPLLHAIEALDYPREQLDVILVVEPDDPETIAAIERLKPRPHLQMLVAPASGPRTKPKALNCALPFVRGAYVAVFDAEDRPDPGATARRARCLCAWRAGGGLRAGQPVHRQSQP